MAVGEITGRILTPDGVAAGRLRWNGAHIVSIDPLPEATGGPLVVPGFIDLHCHGGGGADVMEGGAAVRTVARTHVRHGTTAFLATTMTAPVADIEAALAAVEAVRRAPEPGEAAVLGVHLEGPFISPDRLGAQPAEAIVADISLMARLMALVPIKVVTLAVEADPSGDFIRFLTERGVRPQLGHSSADYEAATRAFACGCASVTHLFNAMTGLHHRAPGIAGAALAHLDRAEVIPDLLHVHPGAIRAALRAIPDLYAVTDATAATAMPEGSYRLGSQTVFKCDNGVRLADGTLAGSCLTMEEAFRNLVSIGLPLEEASRRTSTIAADYLGLDDRGRLVAGAVADFVVLDDELTVVAVVAGGQSVGKKPFQIQ